MVAAAAPATTSAKRHHDCVGFLYYSAFMQQSGATPVCLGFSQVRQEEDEQRLRAPAAAPNQEDPPRSNNNSPAPMKEDAAAAPVATAGHQGDFKMVCVGYSTYSSGAPTHALPHCEGLEVVLYHSPAAGEQQQQQHGKPLGSASSSSSATNAMFAVSEDQQQDQQPQPLQFLSKLASKAAHNVSLVQAALRNEGPVKLKPLPKDMQELETRVMATLERHAGRMQRGAQRVASNAYINTVKPLAAILGLSETSATRPK